MKRILVVAAHPDDELLGCGGTLARQLSQGSEVYCLILGKGMMSRESATIDNQTLLLKSCDQAQASMGITDKWVLDYPDNQYDTVPLLDVVRSIEQTLLMVQPDAIFTHYAHDLNIDHQIAFQATLTACRPIHSSSVRGLYSFYTPSATEWGSDVFEPNMFVDVTQFMDQKLRALSYYDTELRTDPYPRSVEGIKAFTRYFGSTVGVEHAEPFKVIRALI